MNEVEGTDVRYIVFKNETNFRVTRLEGNAVFKPRTNIALMRPNDVFDDIFEGTVYLEDQACHSICIAYLTGVDDGRKLGVAEHKAQLRELLGMASLEDVTKIGIIADRALARVEHHRSIA